jgi:CBS domain-containing protein
MTLSASNMKVSEIMSKTVLTALGDSSIYTVAAKMAALNVGAIVITGPGDEVIGILTERDLMNKVVAKGVNTHLVQIKGVMTKAPTVIDADESVATAYKMFQESSFRHLPVVDKNNKLVGMLSLKDIAKAGVELLGKPKGE